MKITVERDGKAQELTVTLASARATSEGEAA